MVSMVLLEELEIVSDYAIKNEVIDAATKVSKGDEAVGLLRGKKRPIALTGFISRL